MSDNNSEIPARRQRRPIFVILDIAAWFSMLAFAATAAILAFGNPKATMDRVVAVLVMSVPSTAGILWLLTQHGLRAGKQIERLQSNVAPPTSSSSAASRAQILECQPKNTRGRLFAAADVVACLSLAYVLGMFAWTIVHHEHYNHVRTIPLEIWILVVDGPLAFIALIWLAFRRRLANVLKVLIVMCVLYVLFGVFGSR
jgi:hypothetical protein